MIPAEVFELKETKQGLFEANLIIVVNRQNMRPMTIEVDLQGENQLTFIRFQECGTALFSFNAKAKKRIFVRGMSLAN